MKKSLLILFLFTQVICAKVPVWGPTGHRVVGEVAELYLKKSTKRKLNKLLNGSGLALVSTYADEIKSDKRFKAFDTWHYVNVPPGEEYNEQNKSKYGDIVVGIEKCKSVLKDKNTSKEDKIFYLKLLVHFIGDLHQPLHLGRAKDKGGNDIQVNWFGKGTNLHRVWDSDMINHYRMSYTELALNLPKPDKEEMEQMQEGVLLDWVNESRLLAKTVYTTAQPGQKLSYDYMYDNFETVKEQLLKGGVRLAKVLNEIF